MHRQQLHHSAVEACRCQNHTVEPAETNMSLIQPNMLSASPLALNPHCLTDVLYSKRNFYFVSFD